MHQNKVLLYAYATYGPSWDIRNRDDGAAVELITLIGACSHTFGLACIMLLHEVSRLTWRQRLWSPTDFLCPPPPPFPSLRIIHLLCTKSVAIPLPLFVFSDVASLHSSPQFASALTEARWKQIVAPPHLPSCLRQLLPRLFREFAN